MKTTLYSLLEQAQNDFVEKVTHEVIGDYFLINPIQSFLFYQNEFDVSDFLQTNFFTSKYCFDIMTKLSISYTPTDIDTLLSIFIENEEELNRYANDYIQTYNLKNEKLSHREFISFAIENYIDLNLDLIDDRIISSIEEQFDIFIFEKVNYFLSIFPELSLSNSFDDTYEHLAEICSRYFINSFEDLENMLFKLLKNKEFA